MTIFFLFTAIWFAPDFADQTTRGARQIVQIAGVLSSAFSIFIITYSYQQFFKSRTKEFGILMSYGLLYRDMKRMIQNGYAKVIDFNQFETESVEYFTETLLLKNEEKAYTFIHQGTVLKKLFDRYVFNQPVLIVLPKEEFDLVRSEAKDFQIGFIHMFKFNNWLDTGEFVAELQREMEATLQEVAVNSETIEAIKSKYHNPFIVHAKYDRYVHTKQVAGFALFIMSFISMLFFVTICIVLHFKIFADQEDDKEKIRLLQTIGITSTEIKMYLYNKLKMNIALPVIIGGLLGLCLSVAINLSNVAEMELSNSTIFMNGLKVVSLYFIFMCFYYLWLKFTYRKVVE